MSSPQANLAVHQTQPLRVIRQEGWTVANVLAETGDCYDSVVKGFRKWLGGRALDVEALKDRSKSLSLLDKATEL